MFLFSGGRSGGRHRGAGLLVGPEGLGTGADSAVESGSVELRCFMVSGALVEQYGFSAIPRGDKGFPDARANFLCKGGSELHKVLRGSERPLRKKANWHIFSPSHGECFFVRVAVAFWQQGRYSGLAALLQARGLGRNEYREPDIKPLRPNLLALRAFVRAGGALAVFLQAA